MKKEHQDAARTLAGIPIQQRLALLHATDQQVLSEDESAKPHPMRSHRLSNTDFEDFAVHMTDGGGVTDRKELGRSILERLHNRVQDDKLWGDMIHYLKACLKTEGHITPVPGESGVILNGVGQVPAPPSGTKETNNA